MRSGSNEVIDEMERLAETTIVVKQSAEKMLALSQTIAGLVEKSREASQENKNGAQTLNKEISVFVLD